MIEINPGLLLAQVITFLIGMAILWKIAWGPITKILREREETITRTLKNAEEAKNNAEALRAKYESELNNIAEKFRSELARAEKEGILAREKIIALAQEEAKGLVEKAKLYMEEEKAKLKNEMEREVARLSLLAADRLLKQLVDRKYQDAVWREFSKGLSGVR